MANLAIKGHSKRGSEVIERLEMLGGINSHNLYGDESYAYYTIDSDKEIKGGIYVFGDEQLCYFTLEQFEEKFPYKVGDKVMTDDGDKANIVGMVWDNDIDDVFYEIQIGVEVAKYPKELLQPYKEENMEQRQYKELRMPLDDDDKLATEVTIDGNKILPPNGYLIGKITQVDNGMLVEYVKQQPSYPKTHEECFNICFGNKHHIVQVVGLDDLGDNKELFESFIKLKICRDAYWKIAGEQMGLGEPWKPDWLNTEQDKFVLYTHNNVICLNRFVLGHNVLAFPTAEMRDAFLENFKELIESCKELL